MGRQSRSRQSGRRRCADRSVVAPRQGGRGLAPGPGVGNGGRTTKNGKGNCPPIIVSPGLTAGESGVSVSWQWRLVGCALRLDDPDFAALNAGYDVESIICAGP